MTAGIYSIYCRTTDKVYIGRSTHVARRLANHRWALRHGKHENQKLQRAWDKYGEQVFEFGLLEEVLVESLAYQERAWLEASSAFGPNGFNLTEETEAEPPHVFSADTLRRRGLAIKRARQGAVPSLATFAARDAAWADPEKRKRWGAAISAGKRK